jgi:Uma2 family endonuclease
VSCTVGYNARMDASKGWLRVSVEDYLEGEKDAAVKHEYVHGEIFALAGASDVHNTIAGNIHTVLNLAARRKGCRVYMSDMKVRVGESFYYPDVMLVCDDGPDAYYKDKPCVIAEVLSPNTLRTDTNEKRYAYLGLPSLALYLLVDSRRRFVWGYYRTKTGWEERVFGESEAVPVPCAEVDLSAEDIYIQTPYL